MTNNRKSKLIDKKFQISFIAYATLIVIVTAIVFLVASSYFFSELISLGVQNGLNKNDPYFKFIEFQKSKYLFISFISILGIASFVGLWAYGISHKIAGPIHRLKNDLNRKINGEDVNFSFRENDYFSEIPELMNKLKKYE